MFWSTNQVRRKLRRHSWLWPRLMKLRWLLTFRKTSDTSDRALAGERSPFLRENSMHFYMHLLYLAFLFVVFALKTKIARVTELPQIIVGSLKVTELNAENFRSQSQRFLDSTFCLFWPIWRNRPFIKSEDLTAWLQTMYDDHGGKNVYIWLSEIE